MFYTLDQQLKHQKRFFDAFVDLKVEGWKRYSSALNDYTLGYWKTALNKLDDEVQKTGDTVKTIFSTQK
jgi:hypothetical protein